MSTSAFLTDSTLCIGCKACEVACKEWNNVPATLMELTGNSYDNTGELGADSWRHVTFVEQRKPGAYQITRLDTVDAAGAPVCTTWQGGLYREVAVAGPDRPATEAPRPGSSSTGCCAFPASGRWPAPRWRWCLRR